MMQNIRAKSSIRVILVDSYNFRFRLRRDARFLVERLRLALAVAPAGRATTQYTNLWSLNVLAMIPHGAKDTHVVGDDTDGYVYFRSQILWNLVDRFKKSMQDYDIYSFFRLDRRCLRLDFMCFRGYAPVFSNNFSSRNCSNATKLFGPFPYSFNELGILSTLGKGLVDRLELGAKLPSTGVSSISNP